MMSAVPTDRYLRGWGVALIRSAFAFGLLLVLLISWKAPYLIPFVPILLIGAFLGWVLFQYPLLNLATVLCSFVLITDFQEGIQPTEALYGMYYLGYLGHWFLSRLIFEQRSIFRRSEERVLFVFLILVTLSFPLTLLFGGQLSMAIGEWLSLSLLAFYFPVREAIEKYPNGLRVIIFAVFFVGTYVFVRNVFNYQQILIQASYAWEVTRGRAVTNEGLLMVPAFFSASFYLLATSKRVRLTSLLSFVAFFAGLILTQSRGYWIAFLFGAGVLFLFVPRKMKMRLITTVVVAGLGAFLIGLVFFGDFLILILTGLYDRFLSIGTAITSDKSLINRFYETAAVWDHIKDNPILGYGMGVPYRFFDITWYFSHEKPFIHNGYAAMWYKFGLWGLVMILYFLGAAVVRSYQVFQNDRSSRLAAVSGLAIFGSFAAFAVSANTSNPFYVNDTMFIFAVLTGISGGLYSRVVTPPDGSRETVA